METLRRRHANGKHIAAFALAVALVAVYAMHRRPRAVELTDVLACLDRPPADAAAVHIRYPRPGTLFPPDLAAPAFRWEEDIGRPCRWFVRVSLSGAPPVQRLLDSTASWTIDNADWETITTHSRESDATLEVVGVTPRVPCVVLCRGALTFRTSVDEVGAPIFYRDVNLPFIDAVKDPTTIRWRLGAVSSPTQPPVVLEGLPVCGNCHSFSRDGQTLGMDVDYAKDKGAYALTQVAPEIDLTLDCIFSWSDFGREDKTPTFGLLSQVSPDGRHVVSTIKDRSIFVPRPDLAFSQLFFPIRGILAIYERETRRITPLPGADDPRYVQSNPTWSPDGRRIVFARAPARKLDDEEDEGGVLLSQTSCEAFLQGEEQVRYDLYTIPFNGGDGGTPTPLKGACDNGASNYFPKFSPDGKWIVFCRARTFMLLQPDSELYIIPTEGGEARRLACNTERMNSWHSWSPNSRWLVFASKAETPYTRLFLTHIDEMGNSSPPVLLERFVIPNRAANIPEFLNGPADAISVIREQFLDEYSPVYAGVQRQREGDFASAILQFQKALQMDPRDSEAHFRLGYIAASQGRLDDAISHYRDTIKCSPTYASAFYNLANILHGEGEFDEAASLLRRAAQLVPGDARALSNLGLVLEAQGKHEEAEEQYRAALERQPDYLPARYSLARLMMRGGRIEEAIAGYKPLVERESCPLEPLIDLASIYAGARGEEWRDPDTALRLTQRACRATGRQDPRVLRLLAAVHHNRGETGAALEVLQEAIDRAAGNAALVEALETDGTRYRKP